MGRGVSGRSYRRGLRSTVSSDADSADTFVCFSNDTFRIPPDTERTRTIKRSLSRCRDARQSTRRPWIRDNRSERHGPPSLMVIADREILRSENSAIPARSAGTTFFLKVCPSQ